MPDAYFWRCVCSAHGIGETAAQRHAKTCHDFGRPNTNPWVAEQRGKR